MSLFLAVFALEYSQIYICFPNSGDMTSNIEAMIDKTSYFGPALNIPNIKLYNSYVWFGEDFDDS